jgi:hypothetical protein
MKVKLGELTKIRTGKLDANAASENGKYPFFTCSKEPLRISTYSYDCECVLVAGNGDLNVKYYNGKFDAYQRTYIIESNSNGRLHLPYLYYFMTRYIQELRKLSIGGVIKYIKLGNLTDAEISLPSIKEQKDACEKLKKVKDIIDKKEAQISYLDNLIKARFVEMFGDRFLNTMNWPTKKLGDCATFRNGKAHEKVISETGQYVLITSRAIASDLQDVRHTDSLLTPLATGDIVMVMSDVPNGKALAKCLLITENEKYTLNQRICSLSNYDLNPVFFTYLLNRHQFFLSFNDGNGQTNLRKDDILNCPLIRPSIELQNQFANFVAQIDKSKFAVQKSLEKTQLLFDSLMQEYFG